MTEPISELAGQLPPASLLIDPSRVITAYYAERPDPAEPAQRVAFGTSGHRGASLDLAFNEAHILAITEAICRQRAAQGIRGPLFLGMDTHALSLPAWTTALEVLAGHEVEVRIDADGGYTPTPAISHAIVSHNRGRAPGDPGRADGIVVTPSHNPPRDGGFKYNPPAGGPSDQATTRAIEDEANRLLAGDLETEVRRVPLARARVAPGTRAHDYVGTYVGDLDQVVDLGVIRDAGLSLGVDPLGGAGIAYWAPIAERYGLDLTIVNDTVDPTFRFMRVDRDGKIRMDCSSRYAMAGLIELAERFDVSFGNDTDFDRHGIVTRSAGLLDPNRYLAVAISYLFTHRPGWSAAAAVGKTLVSSSLIDRVAADLDRRLVEVPVGFKWFVDGLLSGELGFGGEESAGAAFLRRDGTTWCTDKDGIILDLLAAEMTAVTGKDPGVLARELNERLGEPVYERSEAPATREQKALLAALDAERVTARELAGEPIVAKLTRAPGNDAPLGGLKVTTENGWFAARPSGTEDIYKIYAESFLGTEHLRSIQEEARALVAGVLEPGA